MATLFYSMSGEGRGHATRVKAIVEDLRKRHRLVLYASGQAYALLAPLYAGTEVEVRAMEGLAFCYRPDGTLDYGQTVWKSLQKILGFSTQIKILRRHILTDKPDLIITDFDPLLPKAAESLGVPYLSIDHQHFLTTYSLRALPWRQQLQGFLMSLVVHGFYWRQTRTVVSSFYRPALRKEFRRPVDQVGIMLGEDIQKQTPTDEGFLLVYLRRDTPRRIFRALDKCGLPVRIYGPTLREPYGNLSFHSVDRTLFIQDLARCHALVTTAGNQVVGEALHLGKPVLAMPEINNWEQEINGFFVQSMGVGMCCPLWRLRSQTVKKFLSQLDLFRSSIPAAQTNGNLEAIRIIEEELACPQTKPHLAWKKWIPHWHVQRLEAR